MFVLLKLKISKRHNLPSKGSPEFLSIHKETSKSAFQVPLAKQYNCKKLPIKEFYRSNKFGNYLNIIPSLHKFPQKNTFWQYSSKHFQECSDWNSFFQIPTYQVSFSKTLATNIVLRSTDIQRSTAFSFYSTCMISRYL